VDHVPGTIYLLHFDRPYKHARHWAQDLNSRLAEHRRGTGAPLLQVVRDGAHTWDGDRYRERQLNEQGGRSRMCPACKHPITGEASVNTITPPGQPQGDGVIRADLTAARQARSAVRRALASWGMDPQPATPNCSPPNSPPTPPDMPAARSASRSAAMPRPTASAASPARSLTPAPATPGRPRRGTRPGPVDRHRSGHRQRRPRREGRQDHLVHPRPSRAHRASVPATRVRSRGRSLTNPS